jgi:geranylgeranylglycerol-phosphate geranylgeranyltransferase
MLFGKKFLAYIQISRPLNSLITFLVIIVASIISIDGTYSVLKIILTGLSGALTASAGNVINDYFDINIDKINKPARVLPAGKLSLKEAFAFYIILSIAALLISSFININAFITVFIALTFLFFYSYELKKVPLVGNIVVSTLTGLAFIYGGLAVNNVSFALIPALFALLINFVREIIKDMEDVEGDRKHGVNTYPVIHGFKKSKMIVVFVTSVLIILTLYPFVFNIYTIEYFLVAMIFVNPLMAYIIKSLFEDDSEKNLNKLSNLLKLNMVIGLIAIFLGK